MIFNSFKKILVSEIIKNICSPQAIHVKPIECTRNPTHLGSMSSLSLSLKDMENQGVQDNHSNSSTRHSSFSEDGETLEAYLISEHEHTKGSSTSIVEPNGVVENNSNQHAASELDMHSLLKGIGYVQTGRFQFRSVDASLMLMDLFAIAKPVVQKEVLILLIKLLVDGHPSNFRVLTESQTLKFLFSLAHEMDGSIVLPYFFQLVGSLGGYNIQTDEAKILLQLIQDKTKSRDFQMQVLYVICNILERRSPPSYFHFDGFDSYFLFKFPDRFPSARTGYTAAFWIQISHFLTDEFGLIGWQDQSGNTFELYIKKSFAQNRNTTYYLCIRIHNGGLTEDFLFDQYNFADSSKMKWHHLVVTHIKQKIELIVDGESLQSGVLTYPTVSKVSIAFLGTRLTPSIVYKDPTNDLFLEELDTFEKAPKNSYFCGQLGTVRFFEGIWDEATAFKVYSKGSLYPQSPRNLGVELREFLTIKSQTLEKKESKEVVTVPVQTNIPLSSTPPTELFLPPP